jgi:hypothetical protein
MEFGSETFVRDAQLLKAYFPMDSHVEAKETDLSAVAPENAYAPTEAALPLKTTDLISPMLEYQGTDDAEE